MSRFAFSKEPVVWIGAIVIILQTIQSYIQDGQADATIINNLILVLGTLLARKKVTPVANEE